MLFLSHKDCQKDHLCQIQSHHHRVDQSCTPETHFALSFDLIQSMYPNYFCRFNEYY